MPQLAPAGGLDRTFTVQGTHGPRQQTWHFPSRAECMVCHSRAANYALGPSDLQMNRDFDYGRAAGGPSRTDNQLRSPTWACSATGVISMRNPSGAAALPTLPTPPSRWIPAPARTCTPTGPMSH